MDRVDVDGLIIRSLRGEIGDTDEASLLRWRERSGENEAHYQRVAATWRATSRYGAEVRGSPPRARDLIRLARARERTVRRRIGAGAVAALVVVLALGYLVSRPGGSPGPAVAEYRAITTGAGERATATLPDGTAVRLGPGSTLRLMDGEDGPVMWLEGLAFFGVHPSTVSTLTVRSEHGEATALGTRFEVRSDAQELQVTVLQGRVRVTSGGAAVEVGEGVTSRSVAGGPPSTAKVADILGRFDWMGRFLVFRETPLARAVPEIALRFGRVGTLGDPGLADVVVTGTFTDQTLEEVVSVICQVVSAECLVDQDAFRIGGAGPVGAPVGAL